MDPYFDGDIEVIKDQWKWMQNNFTQNFINYISKLEAISDPANNVVIAIVKLKSLQFDLNTKFYVCGSCEQLESHPNIPVDGATPFRIFWSSVINYKKIYFNTEDEFSIKFEKIILKTYWRS